MHSPRVDHETPTVVVTLVCWRDGGTSVVGPLFNRDRNPPPSCPPSVAPSRTYSYFPPTTLYLSALRLVPSQLSEHRHALRGITHRTRVVVIYAACTLVCTYVRGARVRVRANTESGCTMRQVYNAVQSIGNGRRHRYHRDGRRGSYTLSSVSTIEQMNQ